MKNESSKIIPTYWKRDIESYYHKSQTLCIAVFSLEGDLLYSNNAFNRLLTKNAADSLLNPTFNELLKKKNSEELIFEGFLTIGDYTKNNSIKASIYKHSSELLIIGEVELNELLELNKNMLDLNREVNNLQRQLIKEKQNLTRTNEKLNHLHDEKNHFLGMAAHDLRSPLGSALGYADMLLKRFSKLPSDKIKKFLAIIVDSCIFSLNLLNDLLDISKIESGNINLNLHEVNYVEYIKIIIEKNAIFAEQKDIKINFCKNKIDDLNINIDSQRLEQAINNLLSNAIKYSKPKTEILVNLIVEDDFLKTEVIDEGLGIPPEELNGLFTPFKTTSVKATSGEKSTGLGLAITKKIIEEHGGSISVKSKVGEGSNFNFLLPVTIE